jgi:hypothetical protein
MREGGAVMSPKGNNRYARLGRILSAAHAARAEIETPPLSPDAIMRRIASQGSPPPSPAFARNLEGFLWRLAPLSIILLLLLGAALGSTDFGWTGNGIRSLVEDPAELSIFATNH